mmetsp:Transcript_17163/g.66817  ORF Transcript_17163/g.66817 Transcript_17163/m.66817 type:complete len:302 (-) Transcript_17163:1262-2167(-)
MEQGLVEHLVALLPDEHVVALHELGGHLREEHEVSEEEYVLLRPLHSGLSLVVRVLEVHRQLRVDHRRPLAKQLPARLRVETVRVVGELLLEVEEHGDVGGLRLAELHLLGILLEPVEACLEAGHVLVATEVVADGVLEVALEAREDVQRRRQQLLQRQVVLVVLLHLLEDGLDLFVLLGGLLETSEGSAVVAEVWHVEAQLVDHRRQNAHQRLLRPLVPALGHFSVEGRVELEEALHVAEDKVALGGGYLVLKGFVGEGRQIALDEGAELLEEGGLLPRDDVNDGLARVVEAVEVVLVEL